VPARVHEITGDGSHVAIDAVGSEETCADSILSLRRHGRHVQVGLLPPVAGHPRVPMERVIGWELDLFGSHGMAAADYPGMLALIGSSALQPQNLIERVIGLAEAAALLPEFDKASPAGITIIDPRKPALVPRYSALYWAGPPAPLPVRGGQTGSQRPRTALRTVSGIRRRGSS
jgi:alcohol dehydrogenase